LFHFSSLVRGRRGPECASQRRVQNMRARDEKHKTQNTQKTRPETEKWSGKNKRGRGMAYLVPPTMLRGRTAGFQQLSLVHLQNERSRAARQSCFFTLEPPVWSAAGNGQSSAYIVRKRRFRRSF
jgi:hypothetical protein